jgi:hypothetical protein
LLLVQGIVFLTHLLALLEGDPVAPKRKPPPRQVQRCPRCGYVASLSGACGRCLCPKCVVRCKWVDMVKLK